jgi:hypothetical protein
VWNKEGNTGEPRQDFPQSAIQEFKVYLSQSPAEYGWTAGGAVSMATKSGTNQLHGEGFEFYRNKSMNTIDPFVKAAGQPEPNFSRHQFGGAIGGPLVKDKIHFFQAAERLKNNLYDNVIVKLPLYYGSLNGVFPSPEYNNMTFTRGDWQIDQKQNLFIRYAWQVSDFTCEGCSASSFNPWFSGGGGIKQHRYSFAGAHTWVLTPKVLNEVRGQWTNYLFRAHVPGVTPLKPLLTEDPRRTANLTQIFNFPSLSWGANTNQYGDLDSHQLRDDLSITTGRHVWKFGAGGQSLPIRQSIRKSNGTWAFNQDQPFDPSNLAAFVPIPGSVTQFTAALRNVYLVAPSVLWDSYVEDEWKPVAGLTLNLGLRYEYQAKVFNQGRDSERHDHLPHHRHADQPRSARRLFASRRQEQRRPTCGPCVGPAERRPDRAARRLRAVLQRDEYAGGVGRDSELPAVERDHRQSFVSGPVPGPGSVHVCRDDPTEHCR